MTKEISKERKRAEMQSFCNKRGIEIYLQPITNTTGRVDVKGEDSKIREGKQIFNTSKKIKEKDPKWWEAIYQGYEYYYNKLNKQKNE